MALLDKDAQVFGGVDTHDATIHVAAVNDRGQDLTDREFPTTPSGYDVRWRSWPATAS